MVEPIMSHYEKAWQAVLRRIDRRRRKPAAATRDRCSLLAVSKTFPADAVRAVLRARPARLRRELRAGSAGKRAALADLTDVAWHLIGPLQSNKTAQAAATFDWVETRGPAEDRAAAVGAAPGRAAAAVGVHRGQRERRGVQERRARRTTPWRSRARWRRCRNLRLRGIMGIPAPTADAARRARAVPRAARLLRATAATRGLRSTRCPWECRPTSSSRSRKAPPRCGWARRSSAAHGDGDVTSDSTHERHIRRRRQHGHRADRRARREGADRARLPRRRAAARAAGQARARFPGIGIFGEPTAGAVDGRRPRRPRGEAAADARGGAGARARTSATCRR